MGTMRVRLYFTEEVLGTASGNQDIQREFVASRVKARLANDADALAAIEEECAAITAEEAIEKSMTVFPKEDGVPFIWDYQIRGFFKDSCGALRYTCNDDRGKESRKMSAYKKKIDGCIFVEPRKIMIDMHGGKIGDCQRPLRAQTAQGERIALANSETVPAGSTVEFTVDCLNPDYEKAVEEWLNYGHLRGMCQWRNSGKGRFRYEILDEAGKVLSGNMETWRRIEAMKKRAAL